MIRQETLQQKNFFYILPPEALQTKPRFKETVFDGKLYSAPTLEETGQLTFELAKKILESGEKFDRVIAVADGAYTWVRTLKDYLTMDKIGSVKLHSYEVTKQRSTVAITQPLAMSIDGESVLIFDDCDDSGRTLDKTVKYTQACGAAKIKTAVLCHKPRSIFKPDFYTYETTSWVIFPHEMAESIMAIGGDWQKAGVSKKIIIARFEEIGLPSERVRYFVDKIH